MVLEIQFPNKTVKMLSIKEMKDFPLITCKCGIEFAPLDDTYVGEKPYCSKCRMEINDKVEILFNKKAKDES